MPNNSKLSSRRPRNKKLRKSWYPSSKWSLRINHPPLLIINRFPWTASLANSSKRHQASNPKICFNNSRETILDSKKEDQLQDPSRLMGTSVTTILDKCLNIWISTALHQKILANQPPLRRRVSALTNRPLVRSQVYWEKMAMARLAPLTQESLVVTCQWFLILASSQPTASSQMARGTNSDQLSETQVC
jgi:hypothetical protein